MQSSAGLTDPAHLKGSLQVPHFSGEGPNPGIAQSLVIFCSSLAARLAVGSLRLVIPGLRSCTLRLGTPTWTGHCLTQ